MLAWVDKFNAPVAVTMPKSRAESTLPIELAERNIPTYVHTVNSVKESEKYLTTFGVSEIYTDFLQPLN